jgi:hypothetical protein
MDEAAADVWASEFEVEADLGNYDHLLPKKYQKPVSATTKAKRERAIRKALE